MDSIDALLGLGLEDGAETQALADSLRGKKRAADMFSLSTVGQIAQGAQREQDSVMEGAKRGGVLRQTMAEQAAKKEQADADRLSRENIAKWDIAGRNEAADIRANQKVGKLTNLANRLRPGTTEAVVIGQDQFGQWHETGNPDIIQNPNDYPTALNEKQVITGLGDVQGMASDTRALSEALGAYDEGFSPFSDEGETPTIFDEIPGSGDVSGKPGLLGHVARLAEQVGADDTSAPGHLNALISAITNTKVREGAGLSQTITEIENMKRELGTGMFTDPNVTRLAIRQIKEVMEAELAENWAAVSPQVRARYLEGLGDRPNPFEKTFKRLSFPSNQEELGTLKAGSLEAKKARLAKLKAARDKE